MRPQAYHLESLKHVQGSIADGGETEPIHWELEKMGLVRPVFSYNPVMYRHQAGGVEVLDFSEPVYVYTLTELGAQWLAAKNG